MKTFYELYKENPEAYSAMAAEANEKGLELYVNKDSKLDLRLPQWPEMTYQEKRFLEYPRLGDMIDAFCKSEQGDRSELEKLMAEREVIKSKYPKEAKDAENTVNNNLNLPND